MKSVPGKTTIWLHLVLGFLIAAEAAFIILGMRFVMPACTRVVSYADTDNRGLNGFLPGANGLLALLHLASDYAAWWFIACVVVWGFFEWRVRTENKQWLRVSAMASAALLLFALAVMFTALAVIPTARAGQEINARYPEPVVMARMATLDRLVNKLDPALVKHDWSAIHELSHEAMGQSQDLAKTGAAAATLLSFHQQTTVAELRTEFRAMEMSMQRTWAASRNGDAERVEAGMMEFHEAYDKVKSDIARPK